MTSIVIATRSGLAKDPDGGQFRLVKGRTLADARHPLVRAYPELFAEHTIDLPVDDHEVAVDPDRGSLEYFTAQADEYREQLAAVVEVLREHGALPAEDAMTEPGWLAAAVGAALDRPASDGTPPSNAEEPVREPAALPKARRRAPRPSAGTDG